MSQLSLKVECSAGSHINDCFEEASRLADRIGIASVRFDFNDIDCCAFPDGSGIGLDGGIVGTWTRARGWVKAATANG